MSTTTSIAPPPAPASTAAQTPPATRQAQAAARRFGEALLQAAQGLEAAADGRRGAGLPTADAASGEPGAGVDDEPVHGRRDTPAQADADVQPGAEAAWTAPVPTPTAVAPPPPPGKGRPGTSDTPGATRGRNAAGAANGSAGEANRGGLDAAAWALAGDARQGSGAGPISRSREQASGAGDGAAGQGSAHSHAARFADALSDVLGNAHSGLAAGRAGGLPADGAGVGAGATGLGFAQAMAGAATGQDGTAADAAVQALGGVAAPAAAPSALLPAGLEATLTQAVAEPARLADSPAAPATTPTHEMTAPPDSPEFAPALGAQLSTWASEGVHEARLELNPRELGPVSVQIALDGNTARVDFGADAAATRQALEQAFPQLAAALQAHGLTLTGGGVFQQPRGRGQGEDNGQSGRRARGAVGSSVQGGVEGGDAIQASIAAAAARARNLVDLFA